ncbi:MAG: hypothetical protein AMXMBFR4_09810 [Candidatus Hydrogenedentota bacterium]
MRTCHRCGAEWVADVKTPGVKEYCEQCSAYLHCCLNCRHYNPAYHNQCAIPTTDWVADKEGANFCDEFEFKVVGAPEPHADRAASARDAFGSLFGESTLPKPEEGADAFKRLFGE